MPLVKSPTLTAAKLAANRANAWKSTGPRTPARQGAEALGGQMAKVVVGRETGQPGMLLKTGELETNGGCSEFVTFRTPGPDASGQGREVEGLANQL